MMKKLILSSLTILLAIEIMMPHMVYAEQVTYGEILDDLAKAQKELDKNNQSINEGQNQINVDNETIRALKAKIEEIGKETNTLQQQIADSTDEIESRKKQTKDIIVYYQMSQGENAYLEYVFGGESITDLVYRLSIVEQLTEYNDKTVKDLEKLIIENENRKVELANKEKESEQQIEKLNSEISNLTNSISKLGDLSPGLEQEVETKKKLVEYYKAEGCSQRNHIIGKDCAVTATTAKFSRPIKTGYITSFVGYRGGSYVHRGLDMGSSLKKNTPLYSIGYGTITSIWNDDSTGKKRGSNNINVEYKTPDGTYYTAIYAHLSRYTNVYVGMKVTPDTVLGYMGDTGYATGVHLHLEVWPCRLYKDSNCQRWSDYVAFVNKQYKSGFHGAESVINFPNKTYTTWYTK